MKKILAILMALSLMLMPVLSMAEAAEELPAALIYTHTDGLYSFEYPEGWTLLNAENIQETLDAMAGAGDEEMAELVATYGPQIQQTGMVMLLNETGFTNVNVVSQYVGMKPTDEQLLALAPSLVAQLSGVMEGIQFLNEGSLVELNGLKALMVEYTCELSGTAMQGAQVYVPGAENLYIFTYTCANADELTATAEAFSALLDTLTIQ